ncbi:MAG: TonB-dependent receptor, partial [Deltaproteobacteria bacterium]|nr:TonB-dependent receptor [Deltaproteobacteria bacterium]
MKKYLYLMGVLAVFIFSGASLAENNEDDENTSSRLNEVIVTATRSDQDIKKVPANVTVITEQDIQDSNAKVIADLLRAEEGIVVRDLLGNGKSAQVDMRGFGETGPYNTLVMVDGRRVNSIDLSGTDWAQIPLDQVDRVEIVRGNGSVLYGDNAVGGVINIITKAPSKKLKAKGKATFGSFSRDQQETYISGGYKALSGSVFASQDSTDGYRHDNEFKAKDVGAKLFFDPTDIISFHINGSYHEDELDLPGPLTYLQQKADRKHNNNPDDKLKTKDYFITSGLDVNMGKYGNFIADVSFRNQKSSAEYPDPFWSQARDIENETWSLTPRYVLNTNIFGHEYKIIAGVDLYWSEMNMNAFSGTPLNHSGITNMSRDSVGFYISEEFALMKNLLISGGVRHERVKYDFYSKDLAGWLGTLDDDTKESENAYSVGLTYLYYGDSSVFIRANRSFRFPLLDELAYEDWSTSDIRVNP